MENEKGDFFRFEKFARRTQNDAMVIGFNGGSYFSSTINSLITNFYEKYGMKGSRVNYCYDGATPVTAALLSVRYMFYTLDRGYDNLFELVDMEGKLYLYKNNYSLPLGYMITANSDVIPEDDETASSYTQTPENLEETDDDNGDFSGDMLMELFSDAQYVEENIHEDREYDKNIDPIERQNRLVHKLGIPDDVFTKVDINSYGSQADLYIDEDAHYYAYTSNTKIDTIKLNYEETSKSFSQIKKKYILDLGYHKSGDIVSLHSENGEELNLVAYKVNEPALNSFITKLNQQTMTVDSYDETSIKGHIDVSSAGQLVLSVPYESGWTLYVDGVKTDMDLFEDTFISVYLDEGTHSVELQYFPDGLIPGVVISIICILLLAGLYIVSKKHSQK